MAELMGMTAPELKELAERLGESAYRGTQIAKWLYKQGVTDLDGMTDLPKAFREKLKAEGYRAGGLQVARVQVATDGTRKFLFDSSGCGMIESVLMPTDYGLSVCVSTQIGCAVKCAFCATGLSGFQRNLSAGEIVEQVVQMQRECGDRVTNVVFMGMGEPLHNYDATLKAVNLLNHEVGIGMRHLTVSTSGVVPGIEKLAEENLQLTLAFSLHAPNDKLRDYLVPLNRRYNLAALKQALRDYHDKTHRRITLEYVMLGGVNDTPDLAREMAEWMRGLHVHVNLIPYNATDADFKPSRPQDIKTFAKILEDAGFPTTVRVERGADIAAACGQLRRQAEIPDETPAMEAAPAAHEAGTGA
ncbi:putative dual-specificity RNA methyltransferase RlmN [compost metagenome]